MWQGIFLRKIISPPVKALHTPAKAILNEPSGRGGTGGDGRGAPSRPGGSGVSGPGPTVGKADVADAAALTEACKGRDAVISAYNPRGWANPGIYEGGLAQGYPLILEAAKKPGSFFLGRTARSAVHFTFYVFTLPAREKKGPLRIFTQGGPGGGRREWRHPFSLFSFFSLFSRL